MERNYQMNGKKMPGWFSEPKNVATTIIGLKSLCRHRLLCTYLHSSLACKRNLDHH